MTSVKLYLEPATTRRLIYFSGQVLKGTVELSLEREKSFRGIYVIIFGHAKTRWTESKTRSLRSGKNRIITSDSTRYKGEEVFLKASINVFGHSRLSEIPIQAGLHRFNFEYKLSSRLPYTLTAEHGSIAYYAEVILDVAWRFNKEIKTPFAVVRLDDLNLYPDLRLGQKFEEVRTFCCLFCKSGPLMLQVSVPCTGFTRGQSIPVTAEYVNKSGFDILSTKVKLIHSVRYTSQKPEKKTKTESLTMAKVKERGVRAGESYSFSCNLDIPDTAINSNGLFCDLIKVEYHVEVEGIVDGCYSNLKISFPIIINSIPFTTENPVQAPSVQPSAPAIDDQQKDDLPPSFDEAAKMLHLDNSVPVPSTSNFGWNITASSAPAPEKS